MRPDLLHLQKMVAGACMVVAPLLWLVAVVASPTQSSHEAEQLRATAAHPDRFYASNVLFFAGAILFAVAILGLVHLLHERRPAYGLVGGAITLLGLMTVVGLFFGSSMVQQQMVGAKFDRGQMVSLLHEFNNSNRLVPFYILTWGMTVGLLVLAFGLWRAQAVPVVSAFLLAAAGVIFAFAFIGGGRTVPIVLMAVLAVGLGSVGMVVLREPDTDWEHTPEFRGFRPIAH